LIYNGQEAGNPKRLRFFEKDSIEWREHPIGDLYAELFALKKKNTALWNGKWGGRMVRTWNSVPDKILSFVRSNDQDKVFTVINFSAEPQTVTFTGELHHDAYREYFSGDEVEFDPASELRLSPWSYKVYIQ
jgi:hypothetical protein